MEQPPFDYELAKYILDWHKAYNLFGDLVLIFLEKTGMTQAKLARLIGCEPATISQYGKGKRFPDLGVVYLISIHLRLSPAENRSLETAWESTQHFRNYIPYIEQAIRFNDSEKIIELAGRIDDHDGFDDDSADE